MQVSSRRAKKLSAIAFGLGAGALSWAVVPLVSDRFEPFDSSVGLWIGQSMLCIGTALVAYRSGFLTLLAFAASAYIGMNGYAYVFGSDETRAWFRLGLITSISLVVLPLFVGVLAWATRMARATVHRSSKF